MIYGVRCSEHGFVHGAEAEELRSGLEALIAENKTRFSIGRLRNLLDKVDARDSLAYLEAQKAKSVPALPRVVFTEEDLARFAGLRDVKQILEIGADMQLAATRAAFKIP